MRVDRPHRRLDPAAAAGPAVAHDRAQDLVAVAEDVGGDAHGVADHALGGIAPGVDRGRRVLDDDARRVALGVGYRHWAGVSTGTAAKRLVIDLPFSSGVQLHPTSLPDGRLGAGRLRLGRLARGGRPDVVADAAAGPAGPPSLALQGGLRVRRLAGAAGRAAGARCRAAEELDFREREALLDRGLGRVRAARRGRRPGALRPRVDGAAGLRRRARRADHRRRPDLRRARQRRPPRAPGAVPGRRAWRARRPTPTPTRASCGATRSTTGRRCSARLPLVGRPAAAHVLALRPRAHRPLPRLRLLLVGARRAPSTR